jgi:hypothetical protein
LTVIHKLITRKAGDNFLQNEENTCTWQNIFGISENLEVSSPPFPQTRLLDIRVIREKQMHEKRRSTSMLHASWSTKIKTGKF